MHICLVSTFYYPRLRGGTEHSLKHLAESLASRGIRVTVVSLHEGGKPERFEHNGVHCRTLEAPHLAQCLDRGKKTSAPTRALWHMLDVYNPAAGRLLSGELADLMPDLVQTHNLPGWSSSAWAAVRRARLPHVQVLHDYQLTCPPATRFRNGKNCTGTCVGCAPFCALRRQLSGRVQHVVANSAYTRKVHLDLGFFGAARSFDVIHGAVPAPRERPSPARPGDRLRIGYLGRLHPSKGVELLIDSFIASGRADAVLRIAGGGAAEYEASLRQRSAGRAVEFLGQVSATDFFSSIDVLVVPSLWNEPMGRVVIEAATHGVPSIAAARGGIPELIREGLTGWLFEPSAPGRLAELLRRLRPERLRELGPACLAWGENFNPSAISAKWIALYGRLLGDDTQAAPSTQRESAAVAADTLS